MGHGQHVHITVQWAGVVSVSTSESSERGMASVVRAVPDTGRGMTHAKPTAVGCVRWRTREPWASPGQARCLDVELALGRGGVDLSPATAPWMSRGLGASRAGRVLGVWSPGPRWRRRVPESITEVLQWPRRGAGPELREAPCLEAEASGPVLPGQL